jgi:hypothetical protein
LWYENATFPPPFRTSFATLGWGQLSVRHDTSYFNWADVSHVG